MNLRTTVLALCMLAACNASSDEKDKDPPVETDSPIDTDDTTPDTDDTDPPDTDLPDTDVDTDVDTDTQDTDTCPGELLGMSPADGDSDVAKDLEIGIIFSEDETASASAVLTDSSGSPVALDPPAWTGFGRVLTLAPQSPLAPDAAYTLVVNYSCGTETVAFTTTDLGGPVDAGDVEGRTYAIDITSLELTQPIGFGGWLLGLGGQTVGETAAISVDAFGATTVDLSLGLVSNTGTGWDQDLCIPTIPSPATAYSSPNFTSQSPVLPLRLGALAIDLLEAEISGTFAPGGDFIGNIHMAGLFDTGPTSAAFLGGPNTLCATVGLITGGSGSCVACPRGGTNTCLAIEIENGEAWPTDPFVLQARSIAEVGADPSCP